MKTSIEGFNQEYAMTLKKQVKVKDKIIERKIDCTDLVILRWFVDFYPNMRKVEIDGVQYAWLSHKKLLEDLPLIDISKRAFIDRMQKLVEFGILTYKFDKDGGSISLYGFGANYNNLITNNVTGYANENIGGMRSNNYGVCNQPNTDISIINKSISNKENICINTNTKEIEILDYLNEKAGTRYRAVESNLRLIRGRLKDYTVDELKKVVDNKVRDWKGTSMQQYLRPETLFGATKIETYLNGLAPTCVEDKKSGNKIGFDGQREYAQEEFNDLCADIDNISLDDM